MRDILSGGVLVRRSIATVSFPRRPRPRALGRRTAPAPTRPAPAVAESWGLPALPPPTARLH